MLNSAPGNLTWDKFEGPPCNVASRSKNRIGLKSVLGVMGRGPPPATSKSRWIAARV